MQTYRIPSAGTPDKSYTVTIHNDGDLSCTCPDATYRRRQCKHQRQVLVLWTQTGREAMTAPSVQDTRTLAERYAAEHDRNEVYRITRSI